MDTDKKSEMSSKTSGDAATKNVTMGILSYIGPLVIVSYITAKDDPFVKFHIKQGLVLFVLEIIVWFVGTMFLSLWMLLNLVNIAVFVLAVIGIVNAAQGKENKLPLIGDFAKHFKF
jgi:uncharacterized membrane protein